MRDRRWFLECCGTAVLSGGLPAPLFAAAQGWRMPDEGGRHAATWMAFGPQEANWGRRLRRGAQEALGRIAQAIAAFEPVKMLVRAEDLDDARRLCGERVELVVKDIDDLWIRDSGPVFVRGGQGPAAVNFNFNGWGNKQEHEHDATVAPFVAERAEVPLMKSGLVLEGGALEVDGEGTAIVTESCVLNRNRNPGVGKSACEAELRRVLGVDKVIWLPGIAGRDITDGHTDFYARFVRPGVVVAGLEDDPSSFDHAVTRRHLEILKRATDAKGRPLRVVTLAGPKRVRERFESEEFAAGYINFYLCNGAVIAPQFGDRKADRRCRDALKELLPEREIVQLDIDAIAGGGGGIHCATQQQPS